jgi:hypothetical protein
VSDSPICLLSVPEGVAMSELYNGTKNIPQNLVRLSL